MTDEPENIVLRLLQEIRADVAAMKTDIAGIKGDIAGIRDVQRLHGMRLDTYGENFHDIIALHACARFTECYEMATGAATFRVFAE